MGSAILDLIQQVKPVTGSMRERWQQYEWEKKRLLPLVPPGERGTLCRLLAERLDL
ncbi:MAG: hypothetical protein LUG65_07690 [Clostridiales bacterium]|nr:hypothetical protein [Clostridiales bacterium]